MESLGFCPDFPIKLRMPEKILAGSQTVGAKLHSQKGNSPDLHLRSLNQAKCFKRSKILLIARRLA